MPYVAKGKCVYKKDTGKKVGCTKGPVKKYMAALHANVKESTDKQHIKEFIKNICETDFANANKALAAAVREKVKNAIRGVEQ